MKSLTLKNSRQRCLAALVCLMFIVLPASASANIDSLLKVLDSEVEHRYEYIAQRQARIDSIKRLVSHAHGDQDRFLLYGKLFGQYHSFRMDSAMWAAQQRLHYARRTGNQVKINNARLNMSEAMTGMGMYKESLEILDDIVPSQLDESGHNYYFHQYSNIYTLLGQTVQLRAWSERYERNAIMYNDSIVAVARENSIGGRMSQASRLLYEGNYDEAIRILLDCYDEHVKNGYNLAIPAFSLARAYEKTGNVAEQTRYLVISAIWDIRVANREYISLWKLAKLLYEQGDLKRANTYLSCSLDDAVSCQARYRMQEISALLPIISQSYNDSVERERSIINFLFAFISLLAIVVTGALVYIFRQNRRLHQARKLVDEANARLTKQKEVLEEMNVRLHDSNHVKEEYIGHVFNLCSQFVCRQEEQRKLFVRKLKTGQIDDLYNIVSSNSFVTDELNEFYRAFDRVFLKLFPDYVDQLNALLRPEEAIVPRGDEMLTAEQRIYALIRLGVNDSGKIATFLHYSQQTVYNYRLKLRNKSNLSKEEFMERIMQIG